MIQSDVIRLFSYMAASARGCVDEPKLYGPFRLVDSMSRWLKLLSDNGLMDNEGLAHVIDVIDRGKYSCMTDETEFLSMLDEVVNGLADLVAISNANGEGTTSSLRTACENAVRNCLKVTEGEQVLIIVDAKSRRLGESFFAVCVDLKAETVLTEILERRLNGEEPPKVVAAAMKSADVVIAPTTKSLSHTEARREANKAGARVASMPGITEELLERTMTGNYRAIADLSNRVSEVLSKGKVARVVSPAGTDITMSIDGRDGVADTGMLHSPGAFGNLPAGESYIAPVEGSAAGTIVIDGAMAGLMELDQPITVIVENGEVKEIRGGTAAQRLREMIEGAQDTNARNLAELGIGTNEKVSLSGNLLEVEKVLGTVHLAFGDNKSFGGQVRSRIHVDGVVLRPTLTIDGRSVIREGEILL